MKTRLFCKMFLFIITFLCFTTFGWGAEKTTTLKLGHIAPSGYSFDVAAKFFADKVASATRGQIRISIFPNAQLGSITEHWAMLRTGDLDLFILDVSTASMVEPPPKNFLVMTSPFLFDSQEQLHKFLKSTLFQQMMAKVEKANNMKYLGYFGDRPARGFSTGDKRVTTPADIKGLKLRVPPDPEYVALYTAWGATPTPVGPSELYTSLKSGLVVGMDGELTMVDALKLYEVQKYWIALDYSRTGMGCWINADKWNSLSKENQNALSKAAEETGIYIDNFTAESLAKLEKDFAKAGMTIIKPEPRPWREIAARNLSEKEGKVWEKGLYDKVKAIK
jgi:TRAP-type transport system periplasmic protein